MQTMSGDGGNVQNSLVKPHRMRDGRYLKFVRAGGCVLSGEKYTCQESVDAHHVIPMGGGITGSKVSDYRAVGLCRLHHRLAHDYPVSTREFLEAAITRLNKEFFALYPPKRERTLKPRIYQKRLYRRGYGIVLNQDLQFPIVGSLAEAQELRKRTGGKIVRVPVRPEGLK